jgi:hypothetical protein
VSSTEDSGGIIRALDDAAEHRSSRRPGRRIWDDIYYWMPVLISLLSMMLSFGVIYGLLQGRLTLIEYRINQVEQNTRTAK